MKFQDYSKLLAFQVRKNRVLLHQKESIACKCTLQFYSKASNLTISIFLQNLFSSTLFRLLIPLWLQQEAFYSQSKIFLSLNYLHLCANWRRSLEEIQSFAAYAALVDRVQNSLCILFSPLGCNSLQLLFSTTNLFSAYLFYLIYLRQWKCVACILMLYKQSFFA